MVTNIKSLNEIDLSRPDLIFFIVWTIPLILLQFFNLDFFVDLTSATQLLIFTNILSFFIIYWIIKKSLKNKTPSVLINLKFKLNKVQNFFKFYFIIWLFLYAITILFSGGIPIYWILSGSGLTYYDFGVPTLSGFLNMLRAFLSVLALIIFLRSKNKKYLFFVFFFFISAFIFEANRGGGVVLILHILGYYFLTRKFNFIRVLKFLIFSFLFIIFLGLIEMFRYSNDEEYNFIEKYSEMELIEDANNLTLFTIPAILYITTPLQNLNLLITSDQEPLYYPYHSSKPLIPTFVRDKIFSNPKDYGFLVSEAYNTTSFYTPLIRDFGNYITIIIVFFLQIIVSYIHIKSKTSDLKTYTLLYPPLFMCVFLSPFNLYFTSLVVVSYPLMVHLFIHHKKVVFKI